MTGLTKEQLDLVFPYHIVVNKEFIITQVGNKLETLIEKDEHNRSSLINNQINLLFDISSPPRFSWDWKKIITGKQATFELNLKSNRSLTRKTLNSLPLTGGIIISDPKTDSTVDNFEVIFLVNPKLSSTIDLSDTPWTFSDLSRHIYQRELLLAGTTHPPLPIPTLPSPYINLVYIILLYKQRSIFVASCGLDTSWRSR